MARLFDGDSSEKGIYSGAVVAAMPFSMGCWFYATPGHITLQTLLSIANSSDNLFRLLYDASGSGDLTCGAYDGATLGEAAAAAGSVGSGLWHSLLAVFSSPTSRDLYTNTVKTSNTTSVNPSFSGSVTTVGYYSGSFEFRFAYGRIAEVAFWSGALTQADANILAAGFAPPLVRPDLLAAYYPLIGRMSPEIELRNRFELALTGTTAIEHPRIIQRRKRRVFFGTGVAPATPQTAYPIADVSVGTWQRKGPGYETARNLLTYTESFDNAVWVKNGCTISQDAAADPDGAMTADIVVETTGVHVHYVQQLVAMTAGLDYCLSLDVHPNARDWVFLQIVDKASTNAHAYFNVTTGVIGTVLNCTAALELHDNGYYIPSIVATAGAGSNPSYVLIALADADNSFSYSGTSNALNLVRAQLEQASARGAYQPILATNPPLEVSSTNVYTVLADGSTGTPIDTDYAFVLEPGVPYWFKFGPTTLPISLTGSIGKLRGLSPQLKSLQFDTYQGYLGTLIATRTINLTATVAESDLSLTDAELALVTDLADIHGMMMGL